MHITDICKDCNKSKKIYTKGLCRKCWLKTRIPPQIEEYIKIYQERAAKQLPLFAHKD